LGAGERVFDSRKRKKKQKNRKKKKKFTQTLENKKKEVGKRPKEGGERGPKRGKVAG